MPTDRAPVAFVMLCYGLDAERYRGAFERGEVPDQSPYGFHLAEERGWRLIYSADRPEGRLRTLFRQSLRRLLGFDPIHAWDNRDRLRQADVVWTMTEWEWLAIRCLGFLLPGTRRPVIGNSVWLFNEWESKGPLRRWLLRRLAVGRGVLTVHSDRYLPVAQAVMPGIRVERMYFGVMVERADAAEPAMRPRGDDTPRRILAMGTDWTRDWATFLHAFGNDERFEIDLVCAQVGPEQRGRYANLLPRETAQALSRAEMRKLYAWSDLVVVSMVENRFSGITSAIDGCGHGKPVISTRTGGVPTYFNESEVIYVPIGDAAALRDAALLPSERLLDVARAGQARFQCNDYSSRGMMERYIALSEEVLAGESRAS